MLLSKFCENRVRACSSKKSRFFGRKYRKNDALSVFTPFLFTTKHSQPYVQIADTQLNVKCNLDDNKIVVNFTRKYSRILNNNDIYAYVKVQSISRAR